MTTKKLKDFSDLDLESRILGRPLTFGAAVEALRMSVNLSQAAFARKLKVSRQHFCDVEKGRPPVSAEQAAKFARAFGHPPDIRVELALQGAVRACGLNLKIHIEAA